MILLLWVLNFGISWFNAWSVGKTWTETKATGGAPHFMSWMGATMAAVGFTWCYAVVIGYGAVSIPITDEETGVAAPLLTMEQGAVFPRGHRGMEHLRTAVQLLPRDRAHAGGGRAGGRLLL
jgi:hypothetical protein